MATATIEHLTRSCRALFQPGQVFELRVLGINGRAKSNASGWFNSVEAAIERAASYDQSSNPESVCVTVNPLHEACLSKNLPNKTREGASVVTTDRDVLSRQWFFIDIDARRPTGTSSNNRELLSTQTAAEHLSNWLENEMGFFPGIRAISGNGSHLLYRVDLPNSDRARETFQNALRALADKFDSNDIIIDPTMFNAARLTKLWGTVGRKGINTEDRPHRRSSLLTDTEFADMRVVSIEALEGLAAHGVLGPKAPSAASKRRPQQIPFDLRQWINEQGIVVQRDEPWDDGTRFILEHCLFDPSHDRSSAALGVTRHGAVYYKCHHASCADKKWAQVKALYSRRQSARSFSQDARPPAPATDGATPQTPQPVKPSIPATNMLAPDSCWVLAKQLIDEEFTDPTTNAIVVRRYNETFYEYTHKNRCYRALSDDTMKVRVTRYLGDRISKPNRGIISDVINCLQAMVTVPSDLDMPFLSRFDSEATFTASLQTQARNWITLRNGIVDIDRVMQGSTLQQSFMAHTSEWFSATALPFNFPIVKTETECPTWLNFLHEVLEGDQERIGLLQEAFGYSFTRSTKNESFFVMHGAGRNGKSTVLNVLATMIGEANVSALSALQLSNEYAIMEIYNKLVNVCADMSEMESVEEGLIKAIVSGDLIVANRKYKSPLQFRPTVRLWFSTNVLPRFSDITLGIWRRMILMPFDYIVPVDKMDTRLLDQLRLEMPGIFLWALTGLLRLNATKAFSRSERCEEAKAEYRLTCFPVLTFIEECTVANKLDGEPRKIVARNLWNLYKKWCAYVGLTKIKPLHVFIRDVKSLRPELQYERVSRWQAGEMNIYGIGEKPDLHFQDTTFF